MRENEKESKKEEDKEDERQMNEIKAIVALDLFAHKSINTE